MEDTIPATDESLDHAKDSHRNFATLDLPKAQAKAITATRMADAYLRHHEHLTHAKPAHRALHPAPKSHSGIRPTENNREVGWSSPLQCIMIRPAQRCTETYGLTSSIPRVALGGEHASVGDKSGHFLWHSRTVPQPCRT